MKILVLFQIGCIDIACCELDYISKFFSSYNLFFLCSVLDTLKPEVSILINRLEFYQIKHKLFFHPNKGMDIGPYLLQLEYIFNNYQSDSFDQIFKIHTKTNIKWRNEMLDNLFTHSTKWLLPLDKLNVKHINLICDKFNVPNIYYDELKLVDYSTLVPTDISENFYTMYYGIELKPCDELNKMLGYNYNLTYLYNHLISNKTIPDPSYILVKRNVRGVKFLAGSIFKLDYKLVWEYFINVNIRGIYENLETGYITNEISTYTHAMERIISAFVYKFVQNPNNNI